MAASIEDYLETYKQACTAYAQQKYEVAATLVDQVVQNVPDDPNCHLLRGHIYYVLQQYDIAEVEYQKVLELSDDLEIIGFAHNGLENISHYQQTETEVTDNLEHHEPINFTDTDDFLEAQASELEDLGAIENFDINSSDLNGLEESTPSLDTGDLSVDNPFAVSTDSMAVNQTSASIPVLSDDPFALNDQPSSLDLSGELDLPAFWQEDSSENSSAHSEVETNFLDSGTNFSSDDHNSLDSPFAEFEPSTNLNGEYTAAEFLQATEKEPPSNFELASSSQSQTDENLVIGTAELSNDPMPSDNSLDSISDNFAQSKANNWLQEIAEQEQLSETPSAFNGNMARKEQPYPEIAQQETHSFDVDESFDFEAFESAFGSESVAADEETSSILHKDNAQSNIEFLDDFDEFDDLGNIPGFDLAEADSSFSDVMLSSSPEIGSIPQSKAADVPSGASSDRDEELFTITGSQESVPVFTQTDVAKVEPQVNIEQGWLAPLENATLDTKPWLVAGAVGVFSALVVATVSFAATNFSPPEQRETVRNTGWTMSLAAGITGFATAAFMGNVTLKQVRRTTKDLQAQFDAVRQGNLNVQATVYSEDEFGQLAASFNDMARVILTTTFEAQRKADEQEEAKENLQRQVIRLLDDVEGAARGDLTVQAEVTADVLGAVADAFNLTIQNLRDIVQQVKVAAKEVTKGATNSETFATALSSDALRQAEELAVTLNSVQVMTDSIQRVAEAAREAEAVARDASAIALKGGEAVENTVAGILEIRETVAETTRKVKRLAESSQEISKIVALISQIASRTNLLALNASIEAARAGEAGRGFAIVADEVRQLADKSAKSLKEIEQIVMQIQSETGSVMTAMEEGTQQVIQGTKLAEEAKRSLENIIQVANRIDSLVRSITSDTVEQTETSRAVAQVMQSVELTAQETSQEAQRVSGALQNLVGVSRDLIASVERFRVETMETK
ncbi:methyl-accepting chemotaxis protein [Nostoc sp. PCC 7524]|uniref:methyl-accepting chemotaxis protein n=1 Tax=Nostoc sp. (strain ATCC 29411 / PCC 7524) TaxID=28072 RepID=UPI00029EF904|nr:methyl-accepting chemotaxis protein [Nostoc sp. PCC 7524]AFY49432.1 methyl-accepting chemotaxis protein [Nostoc sp. PCC 7524]